MMHRHKLSHADVQDGAMGAPEKAGAGEEVAKALPACPKPVLPPKTFEAAAYHHTLCVAGADT